MKLWSLPSLQSVRTWEDLRRFSTQAITNFYQVLTRNVGFNENIHCQIVTATIETTNTPINHNLGVVPIGFIVIAANDFQYPRTGTTAWTKDTIYLFANTRAAYTIVILGS